LQHSLAQPASKAVMEDRSFVDALIREVIQPGVEELMRTRFFNELREGRLSSKRLRGFALQHYLSNHAILKGLAFCMVRNANNPALYNQFLYLFNEEQPHLDLMKRFGAALGLTDEDFDAAVMIYECVAHTGAILRGMFIGSRAETRAGALVNETMVCRYSEEFDEALKKHYGMDETARAFFIIHGKADKEHTALAMETVARFASTARERLLVRATARNMVRFKIAKFEGIYNEYS
jgi:pyrroloquinoline quinone (PQQ) biosynthesis protein C